MAVIDVIATWETWGKYIPCIEITDPFGARRFVCHFDPPSDKWVVAHNMGSQHISVHVHDVNSETVAAAMRVIDGNTLEVQFNEPTAGVCTVVG